MFANICKLSQGVREYLQTLAQTDLHENELLQTFAQSLQTFAKSLQIFANICKHWHNLCKLSRTLANFGTTNLHEYEISEIVKVDELLEDAFVEVVLLP
jgi:hypothetical protein